MPTQVSYPGVYIEEVPSGVHTITGVSTSIAAFVDFFREGPMDEAVQIFGMTDFNRVYGGLDDWSEASYAIYQFFLNGGTEAHVVRVASSTDDVPPEDPTKASVEVKEGTAPGAGVVAKLEARNEGAWGDNLRVALDLNTTDPTKLFNLSVTRYQSPDARAQISSFEQYLNLSFDSSQPRYFKSVINDESDLIRAAEPEPGPATPALPASNGTFSKSITLNPASIAALKDKKLRVEIRRPDVANSSGSHRATLTWPGDAPTNLRELRSYLEQAIRKAVSTAAGNPPGGPGFTGATVELIEDRFLVKSGRGDPLYSPAEVVSISADGADTLSDDLEFTGGGGFQKDENVQEYVLGATNVPANTAQGTSVAGKDGDKPTAAAIEGDKLSKSGLFALEDVDLFNILCIPGAADLEPPTEMTAAISAALKYCEDRRAFLIIDIPKDINEVQEVKDWLDANSGFRHKNSALYFPRLMTPDPLDEYRLRSVGASGTMAGLYARIDSTRGVWKAPAGTEASLRGIGGLQTKLTDAQNGTLNPLAINCARNFPIFGDVAWGARTLDGSDLAGSEWKYIPIRRLALFLEESLFRGTKWVVFEPNDEPLWAQIRLNLNAFMMGLFRQRAFQGSTPDKAFFVKCDAETTPQADRNRGIVNIEVGFAPLKPAEFVVIKIQQIAGEL